ncbi:MAG TPA: M20/M25/M40 family metallo-hydrolase, partial [Gemmatimonadales bacterium]|nr:M20/M25/M40 family metallo-hydrolase [Gemmatimonadales bacterium]
IPDSVMMEGTVRSFDEAMRADIKERIRRTVGSIAQSAGATATVDFGTGNNPVTFNDPALTARMLPTLQRVAGGSNVSVGELSTPAEDFALYQQKIPGLFVFLGGVPKDQDPAAAPRNHSPSFFVDEGVLPLGVRTLASLAVDWLSANPSRP